MHTDIYVLEARTETTDCKYIGNVKGVGYKTAPMIKELRKKTKEIGGNTVVKLPPILEDVGLDGAPHTIRGKAYLCGERSNA